ncbi:vWA domain-containing protein [Stutzerimonas stutzeri]|uniref:VWA domain-containing protein n=1 Tax=Stutzerimonas stutzeri TaxID=316 RepID=A0AA40V7P7_STUST|nr:vWA domain-containing protein [Stutzerimonas stutzeri]MBA1307058.1 VWA domain-containing protein [Stutzerimonas stutzeri]MBD9412536.1 serine/threonine protein kinase [Stutzerimonas stutzeri]RRV75734.1 VWA domain-containing protein [Stutzerimonas stutzeri]RRW12008.1 VWA domain-containing protein [Stutzerimonas stutzeri]RRW20948.1 VWA domain-containing protein [Stutzerimonas stutzeri]
MSLRISCAALLALCASATLQAADKPLLQEGKQTLFQRVLTTPNCQLSASAGGSGQTQPAFSRFYVYERAQAGNAEWLRVGPDSYGKTIGWLPAACTVDWKMQLTLAFTNPANRDRLLFFKERPTLEGILDAPDPVSHVAPLRAKLKQGQPAPGVLAQEPEFFVDLQKEFYLLPVLSGEEVMSEEGFRMRLLNVASVSKAEAQSTVAGNVAGAARSAGAAGNTSQPAITSQLKEFSAAVVFVIDSTISMDPYIERTREAIKKVYAQIAVEKLGKQVKFGLVAFRSSTQAVPGLEYVSKMYADPNKVTDGADFLSKVADLRQAKVSSSSFDEDAYSGVMHAIDQVDWTQFGARYVVLITDAGAIDGDSKLSATGLSAEQVRIEASNPGVAIYTLHLKTAAGLKNHGKAEAQYQALSTYPGTNTSLYYPVNAGDLDAYGRKVDALANAITSQVKAAYMGDEAIGSALNAKTEPQAASNEEQRMLDDAALIGHAMQLAYLGQKTGTQAPPVFQAWISDRDLIKQNLPTTDVRVLLTKSQLSDLSDVLKQILDAANQGLISPSEMFERLRSVAATMGADPNQLKQGDNTRLAELGMLGEYLEDLPYQSEVLNLDEETWKSWDGLAQEKFIRTLSTKLRHYQRYNADVDRWVALAKDSDARDNVYPVPLEMMP